MEPLCAKPRQHGRRRMSLADHLRVVATNWWRILAVAVVVGAITYVVSNSQHRVYESSTLLTIAPGLGNDATANLTADELSFRAQFYAAIADTTTIAGPAAKEAHLNIT